MRWKGVQIASGISVLVIPSGILAVISHLNSFENIPWKIFSWNIIILSSHVFLRQIPCVSWISKSNLTELH